MAEELSPEQAWELASPIEKSAEDIWEKAAPVEKQLYEYTQRAGFVPREKPPIEAMDIPAAFARHAPTVLGGVAGGLAASPGIFTTPWGVLWGAMAGEAAYQLGQQALGKGPKTSEEAARGLLKAGWEETKWELLGGWGTRAFGKALAPFAKSVTPEAAETIKLLKGRIKPVVLTPVEATENWALDILGNISEFSIFGGGSVARFKAGRQKFFNDWADDIINSFGPRSTPEGTGDLFVGLINNKWEAHKKFANTMYNNVENLAGDVRIATKTIKDFAEEVNKKLEPLSGFEAELSGKDIVDSILALPDDVDYSTMQTLKSLIGDKKRGLERINKKSRVIGLYKQFDKLVHKDIANSLPAEALEAWKGADAFYKYGQEKFNNTLIRRLLKFAEDTGQGAEFIGKNIFKAQSPSSIRKIKKAVGQKEFQKLQSFYVQRLFMKSVDEKTGSVMGENMWRLMYGKGENAMQEPALKEIFNNEQLKQLSEFTTALKLAQAKQAQGLGRMFIQLTQGGAIAGFATGVAVPEAGAILLSPLAISKILLNPVTARYLTQGFKIPPSSPQAMGIIARLLAAQRSIQNEVDKEQ